MPWRPGSPCEVLFTCSVSSPTPPVELHWKRREEKIIAKDEWSQAQAGPGGHDTLRLFLLSPWVAPGLQDRDEMLFPAGTGHSPWERAHFPNNKCTQDTPCSSNNFLKNEVSLPKVLEFCPDDPVSCCALLVSRDAHSMGGFRLRFCFYGAVHHLWGCCYVLSLHSPVAIPNGISQSSAPALPALELFLPPCPVQSSHICMCCVLTLLPSSWSASVS